MTLWSGIYQIVIGPLRLLMEAVYELAYMLFGSAGGAILPLSLAVNFLLLPFYRRADALQREERALEQRMAPGLAHIRKTFRGDERYMMQRAYYRIHGYRPVFALKSALPLLLQIPFFIAAYGFLSTLQLLEGVPFGPILDLGRPDGLLPLGGGAVNLLPILMTLINLLSCECYTRGLRWKDKLQLYAMALVFLVLLYGSPAGLVLYWTLNNLFSLVKNLIQGARRPERARSVALACLGAAALLCGAAYPGMIPLGRGFLILIALLLQLPACRALLRQRRPREAPAAGTAEAPRERVFLWSCLFLTILTGFLIPSAVIRSSPAEFVTLTDFHSPVRYLLYSLLTAAGAFLLWGGIFYALAGPRGRRAAGAMLWVAAATAVMNYMLFGTGLGMLSAHLQYEQEFSFSTRQLLLNSEAVLLLAAAALALWMKRRRVIVFLLPVLAAAALGMSLYNTVQIDAAMPAVRQAAESDRLGQKEITLSRDGDNVIVVMLDRSVSGFLPYLFREKPELEQLYDGFTWYPNTISYGPATNTGSPGVFGGYGYTPEAMNARADERLADKHNEALLLMPRLFSEAGWAVTVCDPTYAGYGVIPDLSIYDDYPDIHAFRAETAGIGDEFSDTGYRNDSIWRRNFFCYSLMKVSPLAFQEILYQRGFYLDPAQHTSIFYLVQTAEYSTATGISKVFTQAFNVLRALPGLTQLTDAPGAFFMICNNTTHDPALLAEPDYLPALQVDNRKYDAANADRFVCDGRVVKVDTPLRMKAYHANMAALLQLGEYFAYLRELGVYDRTRIIIVSDHGFNLGSFDDMLVDFGGPLKDLMHINSLLLVKDFGSHGFTVDERFMTNADTPALALADVVDDPANPFTGAPIDSAAKEGEQHVFFTDILQTNVNNGNTFLPGSWYALSGGNLFDPDNWKLIGEY